MGVPRVRVAGVVEIPGSVTIIGNSAFYECKSLKSVEIPGSVDRIDYEAFRGCESLDLVILKNANTKVGKDAFPKGCKIVRG